MRSSNGKPAIGANLLKGGVSVLALTAMAATLAAPAYAQDDATKASDSDKTTQVVVVGVRRSLQTAQQIKKNADTIVDSITATDIGSFPDKSVAEALQRVAGVTVNRFAASSDTAHFSAEPSGVLVRGLTFVRSEFNGRDTFSANSSRGLSWGDVSPELMAGVDTYKNQTADLIEGGIAGSINLRTRVPFDSKGRLLALSADASYGDISKKWEPDVSGIFSDRWDTKLGEFGLMLNGAYSHVLTGSQGIQYDRMGIFCSDQDPTDPSTCNANQFGAQDKDSAHNFAYIPSGVAYRDNTYDRVRKGVAFAVQWQPHDHSMLATFQYNKSSYENQMHEHVLHATFYSLFARPLGYQVTDNTQVAEVPGNSFTFDDQGNFTSGLLTNYLGWFGADNAASAHVAANDQGEAFFNACYDWTGCPGNERRYAAGVATATRFSRNLEDTQDMSFNFKWDINDHIKTNFDVQYVLAHVTNYDIEVDMNSYANVFLDATGEYPTMTLTDNGMNINPSAGGLTNPDNYAYNAVMDHSENSRGSEGAARFDVEYDFDDGGWLNSLRAGVRYADRNQHVNWSTYNWKNIGNTYSCNAGYYNVDHTSPQTWSCDDGSVHTFGGYPTGLTETDNFGENLLHGNSFLNENQFVFFNMNVLESQQQLADSLSVRALSPGATITSGGVTTPTTIGTWVPLCERPEDVAGSCYTPAEIMDIDETTQAAYAMLKFGGPDKTLFGKTIDGNVGVRWVQTVDESIGGGVKFPDSFQYNDNNCDNVTLTAIQQAQAEAAGQYPVALNCIGHHSVDDIAFSNGAITGTGPFPADAKATHINWLPSFNLKVNLNDTWLTRFAYSRALSRPDMGLLRNYFYISRQPLTTSDMVPGNPNIVYGTNPAFDHQQDDINNPTPTSCAVGVPCSYKFSYTGASGNPYLKPQSADNFDLTFENYFASTGSFTFDIFYKKFYDYIVNGTRQHVDLTNAGVTRDVLLTGPVNTAGASIKGFEVAYQRFFDFLPGLWSGLGIQTNYTHVVNSGIENSGLASTTANGVGQAGNGVNAEYDNINAHALEGLSKDAYNVVAMYEKGPWALRAAYNWRSKYLVTAADCCVGFPIWQRAAGFLDASVRYRVNDNIELSLQGSNLLNTDTVLMQQVDNRGTLTPNAWFQNDRRIQVGLRLKY